MKYLSKSLEDTKNVARLLLDSIHHTGQTCVVLEGELGAGKTAFAQAVGELLGVREPMQSPTFVIMKAYRLKPTTNNKQQTTNTNEPSRQSSTVGRWSNLVHIDAYRIEKEEELLHLGWRELVRESENLVLIEWPERVSKIIPPEAKKVSFKFINETIREIWFVS